MELTATQAVRLAIATALISASGDNAMEWAHEIADAVGTISEAVLSEQTAEVSAS